MRAILLLLAASFPQNEFQDEFSAYDVDPLVGKTVVVADVETRMMTEDGQNILVPRGNFVVVKVAKAARLRIVFLGSEGWTDRSKVLLPYDALTQANERIAAKPTANDYLFRGAVLNFLGRQSAALDDFDEAIRLKPDSFDAFGKRGCVHQALGNLEQAIDDYSVVIRLRPWHEEAHLNRAAAYAVRGNDAAALADLEAALELNPDRVSTYASRAHLFSRKRDFQSAFEDYSEAIRRDPNNASYRFQRAQIRHEYGDYRGALADAESVMRVARNEKLGTDAQLFAAWLLATCPDDAVRDGWRAFWLAQGTVGGAYSQPDVVSTALAAAYAEVGDFKNAVKEQKLGIAALPRAAKRSLAASRELRERQRNLELYLNGQPLRHGVQPRPPLRVAPVEAAKPDDLNRNSSGCGKPVAFSSPSFRPRISVEKGDRCDGHC